MLSSVAQGQVGVGFAFGLQEALDQAGAFLGPLIFTLVFTLSGAQGAAQYQLSYKLLILPFLADYLSGTPLGGDDAAEAAFFPLSDLPELAFPSHRLILESALASL